MPDFSIGRLRVMLRRKGSQSGRLCPAPAQAEAAQAGRTAEAEHEGPCGVDHMDFSLTFGDPETEAGIQHIETVMGWLDDQGMPVAESTARREMAAWRRHRERAAAPETVR